MARLYANENFPLPAVEELRTLGHDVLTTQDAGRAGIAASDSEVLADATAQNRAVLTFNRRHFIRLHASQSQHAGIVVCTFDPNFAGLAERIDAALNASPELAGRLVRIYRPD
jgi:Domain of unknown function (DUF5615)